VQQAVPGTAVRRLIAINTLPQGLGDNIGHMLNLDARSSCILATAITASATCRLQASWHDCDLATSLPQYPRMRDLSTYTQITKGLRRSGNGTRTLATTIR
jgi:hypothetical protein